MKGWLGGLDLRSAAKVATATATAGVQSMQTWRAGRPPRRSGGKRSLNNRLNVSREAILLHAFHADDDASEVGSDAGSMSSQPQDEERVGSLQQQHYGH
jgi:hypothetical protein